MTEHTDGDEQASVRWHRDGQVAVITLNRPDRRNAFTAPMARRLVEVCGEVDADEQIGAAIVQGEGETFCAGADRALLAGAGSDPAHPEAYRDLGHVYDAFMRFGRLQVPTIAAVRGAAVGAGLNLVLAADLRIMADDARLIAGFLRIGIHPGGGHVRLLRRAVGAESAAAMTLFGEEVSGARAVELGLAWQALPAAEVEARAVELAARAAEDPELARVAVGSFRRLTAETVDWDTAMQAERASQMWSLRRRELG